MKNLQGENIPWYKGKIKELIKEVLEGMFSFNFIKALLSSFAYYIHEQKTWRNKIKKKGKHVRIHSRASVRNAQNISFGDNVRITMDCCIWAEKHSKIIFGNNILVGPGVKMFCGNHGTKLNDTPMVFQERTEADIHIGNDVWIGANSVITAGVSIGDGTVVTRNVATNNVVGDIPAKFIKQRE